MQWTGKFRSTKEKTFIGTDYAPWTSLWNSILTILLMVFIHTNLLSKYLLSRLGRRGKPLNFSIELIYCSERSNFFPTYISYIWGEFCWHPLYANFLISTPFNLKVVFCNLLMQLRDSGTSCCLLEVDICSLKKGNIWADSLAPSLKLYGSNLR